MAMVQMQALACGLPLVCTTNTGGEDLLSLQGSYSHQREHGVEEFAAGYLVPIHQPEAIAWCLRELAQDSTLWMQKREAALALAESELGWCTYGQRAITNYQDLLESKG